MVEQHGYSFNKNNTQYTLLLNDQLPNTQTWAFELKKVVPDWDPPNRPGFWTIVAIKGSERSVYQVDRILNVYAIIPKLIDNPSEILNQIKTIIEFIIEVIKRYTTVKLANEVGFRIGVYIRSSYGNLQGIPGTWEQRALEGSTTVCDTVISTDYREYTTRLRFNDAFEPVEARMSQPNFGSPSNSSFCGFGSPSNSNPSFGGFGGQPNPSSNPSFGGFGSQPSSNPSFGGQITTTNIGASSFGALQPTKPAWFTQSK